jgi:hypothetical protein
MTGVSHAMTLIVIACMCGCDDASFSRHVGAARRVGPIAVTQSSG